MIFPNFEIEKNYWKQAKIVFGIDEAGRGCLAGPVVAAAVAFPMNFQFSMNDVNIKINDSKKLSKTKREKAFEFIQKNSIYFNYSIVDNSIIDKYNILQATQIGMNLCLIDKPHIKSVLLVDGNYFQSLFDDEYATIIKGDAKSMTIAAASIVAKVVRDRYMEEYLQTLYPSYSFSTHKGYATEKHFEEIKKFGKTPFHRNSFLKKFNLEQETENFQLKLF